MTTKRLLVYVRKFIRLIGSDDAVIRTGDPYADALVDRMQDVADGIAGATDRLLFGSGRKGGRVRDYGVSPNLLRPYGHEEKRERPDRTEAPGRTQTRERGRGR